MSGKKLPIWFIAVEILILFLVFQFANAAVRWLHLPIPPALLGMGILFALLASGKVQVQLFEVSSRLLIRHLVLLLLPVIAGIIHFGPVLEKEGWKVGTILVITTIAVLTSTAVFAHLTNKKGDKP
ncbi:CidA/LrgA family protein [Desmospora activa]|uniref:Holin-like protein n=1 Tax=Desmospora activa DSM 45169 TaxID=1121389 RepID=A0A2T4ZBQ7_9BACL|nr:CidA/LrgA family protein [Desmospora activa]PTM59334.1 holin-like protein [Desmospora activa DSM 45169]